MDEDKIEALFKEILKELGVEENTEVFKNTPKRIARSYKEIFAGMDDGNEPRITLFKNPSYNDILSIKDIPFYSMCEHHLLPFAATLNVFLPMTLTLYFFIVLRKSILADSEEKSLLFNLAIIPLTVMCM